jgi:hypothetical protein
MANKDNKITDFITRSPDNAEMNLASRLLGKMLEEQDKKIKEIKISNPINNPARFSQTINPKEKKINSVLKSVKQQVLNEENSRLKQDSQRRSPNERDLHISKESNLPIFMEKEQIKDGKPSPFNQSMKSSDNSKVVFEEENLKKSQFLTNTIESQVNFITMV